MRSLLPPKTLGCGRRWMDRSTHRSASIPPVLLAWVLIGVLSAMASQVSGQNISTIVRTQLLIPGDVAVDGFGNVYMAGFNSDNALKITPGGVITEIIDASGDGSGNPLDGPRGVAVDSAGNVYVTGSLSGNAFKITPGGGITKKLSQNVQSSVPKQRAGQLNQPKVIG